MQEQEYILVVFTHKQEYILVIFMKEHEYIPFVCTQEYILALCMPQDLV